MKYLLQEDYRLLGWRGEPFCLARRSSGKVVRLSPSDFACLLRCDGATEIGADIWPPVPAWAQKAGVIAECAPGARLLPQQEYRLFPNRRMDYVELSITGRCNLNCKHCFNAADCKPRTVEPTLEQLLKLLDRMVDCGVCRIRLDGGEPLTRRDLLTITDAMARRGIVLHEMVTNGTLITPELLDGLEAQGHRPIWFVSFDGLGCHDWLRGVKGTEERVLKNIHMLCELGYDVQVHQCVWRDSLSSIRPTVLRLRELGVSRYRVTTVEPSLRWMASAPEQTIPTEVWQAYIPDFLDWWYENHIDMDLDVWSYWSGRRDSNRVRILPDLFSRGEDDRARSCHESSNRFFIDADGRMVRCIALSGITAAYGIKCPNVYKGDDLQQVMTQSNFLDALTCTCGALKAALPDCQACRWRERCGMGCRAEAMAQCGSTAGIDHRMCAFYNDGCYVKLKAVAEKHELTLYPTQ